MSNDVIHLAIAVPSLESSHGRSNRPLFRRGSPSTAFLAGVFGSSLWIGRQQGASELCVAVDYAVQGLQLVLFIRELLAYRDVLWLWEVEP
jgi:hypothetical protein